MHFKNGPFPFEIPPFKRIFYRTVFVFTRLYAIFNVSSLRAPPISTVSFVFRLCARRHGVNLCDFLQLDRRLHGRSRYRCINSFFYRITAFPPADCPAQIIPQPDIEKQQDKDTKRHTRGKAKQLERRHQQTALLLLLLCHCRGSRQRQNISQLGYSLP